VPATLTVTGEMRDPVSGSRLLLAELADQTQGVTADLSHGWFEVGTEVRAAKPGRKAQMCTVVEITETEIRLEVR